MVVAVWLVPGANKPSKIKLWLDSNIAFHNPGAFSFAQDATHCTVRLVVPLIPLSAAVIVVVPGEVPVANPRALTTAIVGLEELHVAPSKVWVLPSLKFPAPANCCELPKATFGWAGESVIDVRLAFVTVTVAVAETDPSVAVIVASPGARPETIPV